MIAAWIIAETTGIADTVLGFFTRGGLFMWPLLACSIVSVTTMILRGMALREKNVMPPLIEHEIERLEPGENPERLSRIVHHDHSSLARVRDGKHTSRSTGTDSDAGNLKRRRISAHEFRSAKTAGASHYHRFAR